MNLHVHFSGYNRAYALFCLKKKKLLTAIFISAANQGTAEMRAHFSGFCPTAEVQPSTLPLFLVVQIYNFLIHY